MKFISFGTMLCLMAGCFFLFIHTLSGEVSNEGRDIPISSAEQPANAIPLEQEKADQWLEPFLVNMNMSSSHYAIQQTIKNYQRNGQNEDLYKLLIQSIVKQDNNLDYFLMQMSSLGLNEEYFARTLEFFQKFLKSSYIKSEHLSKIKYTLAGLYFNKKLFTQAVPPLPQLMQEKYLKPSMIEAYANPLYAAKEYNWLIELSTQYIAIYDPDLKDSETYAYLMNMGISYYETDQLDKAEASFLRILNSNQTKYREAAQFFLGFSYMTQKRYELALSYFVPITSFRFTEVKVLRARCLMAMGSYSESITLLNQAQALSEAMYWKAVALICQGDLLLAMKQLESLVANRGYSKEAGNALFLYDVLQVLMEDEKAFADFIAFQKNLLRGNTDASLELVDSLIKNTAKPSLVQYYQWSKIEIFIDGKRYTEAVEYIAPLLDQVYLEPFFKQKILFELGLLYYERLHQPSEGRQILLKLTMEFPNTVFKHRIREILKSQSS